MDKTGTPETVDEWIRKLAETTSAAELMRMRADPNATYSEEDYSDTVDEHEELIRWHLVKAGLLQS